MSCSNDNENMDLESIIMYIDMDTLVSMNKLPGKPRSPEEIIADSFEGFLRDSLKVYLRMNVLLIVNLV